MFFVRRGYDSINARFTNEFIWRDIYTPDVKKFLQNIDDLFKKPPRAKGPFDVKSDPLLRDDGQRKHKHYSSGSSGEVISVKNKRNPLNKTRKTTSEYTPDDEEYKPIPSTPQKRRKTLETPITPEINTPRGSSRKNISPIKAILRTYTRKIVLKAPRSTSRLPTPLPSSI